MDKFEKWSNSLEDELLKKAETILEFEKHCRDALVDGGYSDTTIITEISVFLNIKFDDVSKLFNKIWKI